MDSCIRPESRKPFSKKLKQEIYQRDEGKCRHCDSSLDEEASRSYHIDHHPIPHRDIINNACANRGCRRLFLILTCGRTRIITDPMDKGNLKLSCPQCNISHQNEPDNSCIFCGHTQPYCYRPLFYFLLTLSIVAIVFFSLGFTTGWYLKD